MNRAHTKQRLIAIVAFVMISALIGFLVMLSGIVPVTASSGHWKTTKAILHFSKQRSVATHSQGIVVPPLDDQALVLKGAGHFETGCIQCHGSPTQSRSPVALAMTPTPPLLPAKITEYQPEELFYIVKHGIKMTGMPAWPAQQRDDEVWAMVAFLLELPEMEPEEYDNLIHQASSEDGRDHVEESVLTTSLLESCHRCHGRDGLGRGEGAFPKLAGQNRAYLLQSLQAYAEGTRHSGTMQPVAAVLDGNTLELLADHYSQLPSGLGSSTGGTAEHSEETQASGTERDSIDRGRMIALEGIPDRNVPACVDCHGPSQEFVAESYPLLSGQFADYIVLQLRLFKSEDRGGTDQLDLMRPVVKGMTDQDCEDVAAYYASGPDVD